MIEITPKTKYVVLPEEEARLLRREMERAFVLMDVDIPGGMYSMENMKRVYPLMAEIFKIL